jgi:hypothetical protein
MTEQRQQTPEASIVALPAAPARAAGADAGRAAREWWWAGRLMALHGFPVEQCPHRTPGAPRRRWLAGFASGTRLVADRGAPPV